MEQGIIEESRSAFGVPIVTVRKRDGTLRLYVDDNLIQRQ